MVPVRTEAERRDTNAQRRAHFKHRHIRALIGIGDVGGIEPTAIGADHHIAPLEIALAPLYRQSGTSLNDRNDRVLRRRSGSKVGVFRGVCQLCEGRRGPGQQRRRQNPHPS